MVGRKACVQLLTYVQSLRIVYEVQADFFEQLGGDESTPNWLIRRRLGAQRRRTLQAQQLVDKHDVEACGAALRQKKSEGKKFPVESTCLEQARLRFQASDDELNAHDAAEAAHSMRDEIKIREEEVERVADCKQTLKRVRYADDALTQAMHDARTSGSTITLSRLPKMRGDCTGGSHRRAGGAREASSGAEERVGRCQATKNYSGGAPAGSEVSSRGLWGG